MKVILVHHAEPPSRGWGWISARQYQDWVKLAGEQEPMLNTLEQQVDIRTGSSTVLVSPWAPCLATALRMYPDRRLEVDKKYQDPTAKAVENGIKMPRFIHRRLASFQLLMGNGAETAEDTKRRVIETAARLIELAKKDGESVMVGQSHMLRLVGLKLKSIGFVGPLFAIYAPGRPVTLNYFNKMEK